MQTSNAQFLAVIYGQLNHFLLKVYSQDTFEILLQQKLFSKPLNISLTNTKVCVVAATGLTIFNVVSGEKLEIQSDEEMVDFTFKPAKGKKGYSLTRKGVQEWSMTDSKLKKSLNLNHLSSKIAINNDETLLAVGGTSIDIVEIKTWRVIKTFTGHASNINGMVWSKDNRLFSFAQEDRFISSWSLNDDAHSGIVSFNQVFVVESPPKQLSVGEHLFALLENGTISVWDTSSQKPQGIIELDAQDSTAVGFLSIHANTDGTTISTAYGSILLPKQERLTFVDANGQIKPHFVISRYLKQENEPRMKKAKAIKPNVVGPTDMHSAIETEVPTALEEPSLEDQLKQLIVETPMESKALSQNSLQSLLTQAINSSDIQMLEKALSVTDRKIIHATIRRLSPPLILTLLDQLVVRLQKRPNRAGLLIEWIRASLLHHSGYLLSVPHLTQRLGSLYRTLNARQAAMQKLMVLSGRLDMISSQMDVYPVEDDSQVVVFDANEPEESEQSGSDQEGNSSDEEDFEDFEMEE